MAYIKTLKLRLFLEGVEVPIVSCQVSSAPNSPMSCSIQIPPLPEATRFDPRTLVHVYFLDLYRLPGNPNRGTPEGSPGDDSHYLQELVDAVGKVRSTDYKLLFGGEVVGFQWTKTPHNRSVVLQCQDWSNYWDYAFQYSNTGIFGPGMQAVFSGGGTTLFTDFLSSKGEVITNIVSSGKCNTYPKMKGLAAGIVRLIEAIGGTYYPRYRYVNGKRVAGKRYAGQNIFFSYNELRLHLTQMLAAIEEDPTSQRLLQRQGYSGLFDRLLGGQGTQVSIRSAINALTRIMFHEVYPQPCPRYKPGSFSSVIGVVQAPVDDNAEWKYLTDLAVSVEKQITRIREWLRAVKTEYFRTKNNAKLRVTRTELRRAVLSVSRECRRHAVRVRGDGIPEPAPTVFNNVAATLNQASYLLSYWVPTNNNIDGKLNTALDDAYSEVGRNRNLVVNTSDAAERVPAQLLQQVFRPDTWFCAPIRCNVLFPEHYHTLQYQRMFLKEPTRFLLKTHDEFFGEDELFDKLYFAPQAGSIRADRARLLNMLRRDLLEHEVYTGILPVFEKMGEFNVFARWRETQKENLPIRISLAQRSTNFMYFRHRFNARQMQVEARFNPYVAVGFPGLIIDTYLDPETLARHNELRRQHTERNPNDPIPETTTEVGQALGTNFLGNFQTVAHAISNSSESGSTSIVCTFPRQPDEAVEFLGTIPDGKTVVQRELDQPVVRETVVAATAPPGLYSLGPNGGRITNIWKFPGLKNQEYPVFYSGYRRTKLTTEQGIAADSQLVPIDVPVTGQQYGPLVTQIAGSPDIPVVFQSYQITEELPKYKLEQHLLPAEEYIRPGWYGDVWSNRKISEAYRYFFGIGSITEATEINDYGRTDYTVRNERANRTKGTDEASGNAQEFLSDALFELEDNLSIQQAVEFLWNTYSYARQSGRNLDDFIEAYTWRPIATLVDMFGTDDLEFDETGSYAVAGVEGFHSRAFGDYDNLFTLVNPEIEDVLGVRRNSKAAARIDVRRERREKIKAYVASLRFGRTLLG